jgi:peptidoglycan/xylan/chitin deacetylase (PgdA/CDA1 family)/GT2 family glycosyltransferase
MTQLSVILQTERWNERLRACLEALAHQTLDRHDFEVIVVDHSNAGLEAGLAQMALPYSCKAVRATGSNPGQGFKQGVEAAGGRFCLFIKEDQIAAPGLFAEHLRVQLETEPTLEEGVIGIGCVVFLPRPQSNSYIRQYCRWQKKQSDALASGERPLTWADCNQLNFCASRQAILAAGNFSEELLDGAEIDLVFRLVQGGGRCVYLPGAVCTCEESRGFTEFAHETVQRGASYVNLWHRQPAMLPGLLGNFYDTSLRGILLRRFFLWLTLPPIFLALVGPLLGENAWASEWFKFFERYCFWYGVKRTLPDRSSWQRLIHGTPILMYHAIGSRDEPASRYILPVARFARQMALLKFLGYRVISLEEYLDCLVKFRLAPERSLVITLDDGYLDNFQFAFPVLGRYRFTATIFVVSGGMGSTNQWDEGSPLTGRPVMTVLQARQLHHAGISSGAHTCSHPTLTEIPLEQSVQEIQGSKDEMERELGVPVTTFAYPHGKFNPAILAQVQRAGYKGACSVQRGLNTPASPPFALYRTEIFGTTSLFQFLRSVWSG